MLYLMFCIHSFKKLFKIVYIVIGPKEEEIFSAPLSLNLFSKHLHELLFYLLLCNQFCSCKQMWLYNINKKLNNNELCVIMSQKFLRFELHLQLVM